MAAPVTFVIDRIPPTSSPEDQSDPFYQLSFEHDLPEYHLAIKNILGSMLNREGKVDSILVCFDKEGWFKINPQASGYWDNVTQNGLQDMLFELFANGRLVNTETNQVMWERVQDIATTFSAYSHVVACCSGERQAVEGCVSPKAYFPTLQAGQPYVFVFGEYDIGDTRRFITQNLKVSNYQMTVPYTVAIVVTELEEKWKDQ